MLGHSVRYEPFHDSGIRADAIADAMATRRRSSSFFDGHTALACAPALRSRASTGAREFGEFAEVVVDPDGRPTGALLEARRWTSSARSCRVDGGRTLDAFAATLRRVQPVGLTGAHVMIGDPDLLTRAARWRRAAS